MLSSATTLQGANHAAVYGPHSTFDPQQARRSRVHQGVLPTDDTLGFRHSVCLYGRIAPGGVSGLAWKAYSGQRPTRSYPSTFGLFLRSNPDTSLAMAIRRSPMGETIDGPP